MLFVFFSAFGVARTKTGKMIANRQIPRSTQCAVAAYIIARQPKIKVPATGGWRNPNPHRTPRTDRHIEDTERDKRL